MYYFSKYINPKYQIKFFLLYLSLDKLIKLEPPNIQTKFSVFVELSHVS